MGSYVDGDDLTPKQRLWVEIGFRNGHDQEWVDRCKFWVTDDGRVAKRAALRIRDDVSDGDIRD